MSKVKRKAAGRTSKNTASSTSPKAVDLEALREKIARHVGAKSLAMVKTTTDEVVKLGNLAALRYLFELIGLYPPAAASMEETDSDELARALMARLDFGNESDPDVAKVETQAVMGSDSVE